MAAEDRSDLAAVGPSGPRPPRPLGPRIDPFGLKSSSALRISLNLLKPHRAENGREELHRRVALRSARLFEADSAAMSESGGEVRPARSLLGVIERLQDLLPLIRGER